MAGPLVGRTGGEPAAEGDDPAIGHAHAWRQSQGEHARGDQLTHRHDLNSVESGNIAPPSDPGRALEERASLAKAARPAR